MARKKLDIPNEVKKDIQKHLSEKYPLALEGFLSANEEEDALTGDLGATLRIRNQKVLVKNSEVGLPGVWTWGIDYHKFRGRGPGATENKLGADGIFELTLKVGRKVEKKSLMFQSKINWTNDDNLIKETIKLTTWREASFILNFTPTEFEAIDIDSVVLSRGKRNDKIKITPLDKFIGTNFLDCVVGDVDLKYDGRARKLIWRTTTGQIVATKFSIPHKIALLISAPKAPYGHNFKFDKEIKNEEIPNYRMEASPEEMLNLSDNYSPDELKKAMASKSLIYHSGTYSFGDAILDELMKRRMQEINSAHDLLKQKI